MTKKVKIITALTSILLAAGGLFIWNEQRYRTEEWQTAEFRRVCTRRFGAIEQEAPGGFAYSICVSSALVGDDGKACDDDSDCQGSCRNRFLGELQVNGKDPQAHGGTCGREVIFNAFGDVNASFRDRYLEWDVK